MISNPITGAKYFINGAKLLNSSGVRRYVLIPLLVNILIFILAITVAFNQFDVFIKWALSGLPTWLSWLEWFMWPLFTITFFTVVFYLFSIIANIISAPFNGPLAAALERHLTNSLTMSNEKSFIQESKDAMWNELIKLKHSLYLMMPLIFLSLIAMAFPLIAPAVSLLWLSYTGWVLTLEYADYPMANNNLSFLQIREKLASKRFLSLGFGSMVMLMTLIPIVNFLVIPVAVSGATLMYIREFKD